MIYQQSNIDNVFYGSDMIASGYVGTHLIFPTSTPPVPPTPTDYKAKTYSHQQSFTIPLNGSSILTWEEINSLAQIAYYVEITTAVTELGSSVFQQIESVSGYSLPNTLETIGFQSFYLTNGIETIDLPNSLQTIGNSSFMASSIEHITIPSSVRTIESQAFDLCPNLSSITIEEGVTTIGSSAFDRNIVLTSITIPNSVTNLGEYCFNGCSGMTSLTIGSGLTLLPHQAFSYCTSLVDITSLAMQAPLINPSNPTSFSHIGSNGVLHVPSGSSGYDAWLARLDNWTIDYI